MDTNLVFAVLQATGIVILGIFALLMANTTLKRKISNGKLALCFVVVIILSYLVSIPLRYYSIEHPPDYGLGFNASVSFVNIIAVMAEVSAILLVTAIVCSFASYIYAGKTSSKIFVASFTSLISLIVCSFISDYAVYTLNLAAEISVILEEYYIFYLVIQTLLAAASLAVYYFLIRRSVQALLNDTQENMKRFIAVPVICYILYVINYCIWYVVPNVFESDMCLQYLFVSVILPVLYIIIFRLIFTEISNTAKSMRTETELNSARLIQSSILPPSKTYAAKGVNISSMMVPAREIGGDFYDFFELDDGRIAMVIADVSGKGIPAALFMMRAHTLIKSNLMANESPAEALTRSNEELLENNDSLMFVTVFAAILDAGTGKLIYTCAGHNPPLLKNIISGYLNVKKAPFLGVTPVKYENYELDLEEGSILLLYTDGITEAMNENEEPYGEKRLADLADRAGILCVSDLIRVIYSDVQEFSAEPNDDITVMALEYTGNGTKICVPAEINQLEKIQSVLDELNIKDEKLKNSLRIVIEEIFANIAQYAYPDSPGRVSVTFKTGEYLELRFEDRGIEFNPLEEEDPDTAQPLNERREGGYGIYLSKKMMDSVSYKYQNGKNTLTLAKKIA